MKTKIVSFFLFFLTYSSLYSQDTVRIMTYNLLNYSAGRTEILAKNRDMRKILKYTNPDILAVQELNGSVAPLPYKVFYDSVVDNKIYNIGDYIANTTGSLNSALYYNKSKFSFISTTPIKTLTRNINEFKLVNITSKDTFSVFVAHLTPASDATSTAARAKEIDSLRKYTDKLPLTAKYFVCGDFNIYKETELSYQNLINTTNTGYFIDPLNMKGSFDQQIYSKYHTQSPRKRKIGFSASGGMDSRFDFILHSETIKKGTHISYVDLQAVGNDGNHYKDSVNSPTNKIAPKDVLQALHDASDHLPVMARYLFKNATPTHPKDTVIPKDTIIPKDTTVVKPIDPNALKFAYRVYLNEENNVVVKLDNPKGEYILRVYDVIGNLVYIDYVYNERIYSLTKKGMFFFSLQDSDNKLEYKKLVIH